MHGSPINVSSSSLAAYLINKSSVTQNKNKNRVDTGVFFSLSGLKFEISVDGGEKNSFKMIHL